MTARALLANANALHIPLADNSVQTVVTSPPYYGLRDYGVDGQLGLETTPDEYVANMVAVFREVWRVLRDDGTLWLNIGDSYAGGTGGDSGYSDGRANRDSRQRAVGSGLPGKNLIGIPWRLAFALQADGWYLRQDCIWHKTNPMPESVTDRCTKAHEYVFLLSKSARYYYDADAVAEPGAEPERQRSDRIGGSTGHTVRHSVGGMIGASATRNRRSVWTIPTQPYAGAHYATMPPMLAELCIKAGSSEQGCCSACGAPWQREIERGLTAHDGTTQSTYADGSTANRLAQLRQAARERGEEYANQRRTIGWNPTCTCDAECRPCVVFDPFTGSGTTVMVAQQLGRVGVGIDLSHKYLVENARERTGLAALDRYHGVSRETVHTDVTALPLFGGAQ